MYVGLRNGLKRDKSSHNCSQDTHESITRAPQLWYFEHGYTNYVEASAQRLSTAIGQRTLAIWNSKLGANSLYRVPGFNRSAGLDLRLTLNSSPCSETVLHCGVTCAHTYTCSWSWEGNSPSVSTYRYHTRRFIREISDKAWRIPNPPNIYYIHSITCLCARLRETCIFSNK